MGSTGVEYPMMMSTVFLGLLACVLVPCFVNGAWKEDCEQGFVKISGQCYHFSKNKVNYDTAVTRCKARTGELLQENEAQSDVKNHLVEINKGEWGANRRAGGVGPASTLYVKPKALPEEFVQNADQAWENKRSHLQFCKLFRRDKKMWQILIL